MRGKTWADALVFSLCRRALRGDAEAMIEVFNRIDGKVPEIHEISGPASGPISLCLESTVDGTLDRKQVERSIPQKRNENGMPFEKGKSGNPATQFKPGNPGGGRPPRDHITRHLHELLELPAKTPVGRKIAKTLLDMALKRNMQVIREVLDRVEGRPSISIGGVPGEPIEIAGDRIPRPYLRRTARVHRQSRHRNLERLDGPLRIRSSCKKEEESAR